MFLSVYRCKYDIWRQVSDGVINFFDSVTIPRSVASEGTNPSILEIFCVNH